MENRQEQIHRRVQKRIAGQYLQNIDPGLVFSLKNITMTSQSTHKFFLFEINIFFRTRVEFGQFVIVTHTR